MNLTPQQRETRPIVLIVDRATLAMLALHAKQDPAAYAAGLLMRTCKTAMALNIKPDEVAATAAASVCVARA